MKEKEEKRGWAVNCVYRPGGNSAFLSFSELMLRRCSVSWDELLGGHWQPGHPITCIFLVQIAQKHPECLFLKDKKIAVMMAAGTYCSRESPPCLHSTFSRKHKTQPIASG